MRSKTLCHADRARRPKAIPPTFSTHARRGVYVADRAGHSRTPSASEGHEPLPHRRPMSPDRTAASSQSRNPARRAGAPHQRDASVGSPRPRRPACSLPARRAGESSCRFKHGQIAQLTVAQARSQYSRDRPDWGAIRDRSPARSSPRAIAGRVQVENALIARAKAAEQLAAQERLVTSLREYAYLAEL